MLIQSFKEKWDNQYEDCIKAIQILLAENNNNKNNNTNTNNTNYYINPQTFSLINTWIITNDLPAFDYLEEKYHKIQESPFVFLDFLINFKLAVENGDFAFVKMKFQNQVIKEFLILENPQTAIFKSLCIADTYSTIKYYKKNFLAEEKDFTYSFHQNPQKFILDNQLLNNSYENSEEPMKWGKSFKF